MFVVISEYLHSIGFDENYTLPDRCVGSRIWFTASLHTACWRQEHEKTSKTTGNTYFAGRWGNAKVLLFKSKEVAEDGSAIWDLKLAQAQPRQHQKKTPAIRFDDSIDIPNEGPAPFRDEEIPF